MTLVIASAPDAAGVAELRAAINNRLNLLIADSPDALASYLPTAEVVLAWDHDLYAALAAQWEQASNLRWVHSRSAGVDTLLSPTLTTHSALLTNSSGIYSQALAEFAIGAILFFAKRMRRMIDDHARRRWQPFEITKVSGATLGICGPGSVGRAVARAGRALGMRVLAVRRNPTGGNDDGLVDAIFGPAELPEMLAASDYVVACLPLTRETQGLIGAVEMAAMKPGSYLINIGRGAVVQEAALIRALQSGHLAGAALDVYEVEPLPPTSPLYDLETVLLSPHCADRASDVTQACIDLFLANLDRYLAKAPLMNLVDKRSGY